MHLRSHVLAMLGAAFLVGCASSPQIGATSSAPTPIADPISQGFLGNYIARNAVTPASTLTGIEEHVIYKDANLRRTFEVCIVDTTRVQRLPDGTRQIEDDGIVDVIDQETGTTLTVSMTGFLPPERFGTPSKGYPACVYITSKDLIVRGASVLSSYSVRPVD